MPILFRKQQEYNEKVTSLIVRYVLARVMPGILLFSAEGGRYNANLEA